MGESDLFDEDWWCYEKELLKIKYRKLENMQIGQKKKTTGQKMKKREEQGKRNG